MARFWFRSRNDCPIPFPNGIRPMIDVACPACAAVYKVPETLLGKNLRCKGCQANFVAAAASPAPASPFADLPASAPADAPQPAADKPARGRGKAVILVTLVLLGLLAVGGLVWFLAFGGVSWQEFASKEGGFVVLVPGSPTPGKANDAKMGVELKEIVAKPSKSGPTYTVQYADLREKPINDYLYLSWLKHNLLDSMPNGKLSEELEIKLGSHTGKQLTLDLPEDQRLVRRMYLVENRIFLVTALHPRTTVRRSGQVSRLVQDHRRSAEAGREQAGRAEPAGHSGRQGTVADDALLPAEGDREGRPGAHGERPRNSAADAGQSHPER